MALIDGMLQELELEAETTRRVLARVPEEHFSWRPHPRARTLGELALHIATVPGSVAKLAAQSPVQAPDFADNAAPTSTSESPHDLGRERREGDGDARRNGR